MTSRRFLFLIVISTILIVLFYVITIKKSVKSIYIHQSISTILIQNKIYPRHKNDTISNPLFITMADSFYLLAVENFHFQLKHYDLHKKFLVICLDVRCVQFCRLKKIVTWTSLVNTSVTRIKFDALIDLVQTGFDFVMFDSDVFLTSKFHPLSNMSEYSDLSWDIQFQLDHSIGRVNFGWFWARPSQQTLDLFQRARQQWELMGGWDQYIINGILLRMKTSRQSISIKLLDGNKFFNFMNSYWYKSLVSIAENQTNFYDLDARTRYQMIKNASDKTIMWHYTCIEKDLKIFFAKYYGQWTNVNGYYTKARKFILPINLNHTNILLTQFVITIKLALISGRTLVFPDTIQNYPAVRIFSLREIDALGIDYVESTFFFNRQVKHNIDMPDESLIDFSATTKQSNSELILLDFSKFNSTETQNFDKWWSLIRFCRNMNQEASCLGICT